MYNLQLLSSNMSRVEWLLQRVYNLQSLKCLLSSLYRKLANPYSKCEIIVLRKTEATAIMELQKVGERPQTN
jgi:hypothetical protein